MSSPCQNGGTCVANYKYYSFDCRCKAGFFGEFCEKGNLSNNLFQTGAALAKKLNNLKDVQARTTKLCSYTLNLSGNIFKSLWRVGEHWCYHGNRDLTAWFFKICISPKYRFCFYFYWLNYYIAPEMASDYVIVSINLWPEVGNEVGIVVCSFSGHI